MSSAWMSENWTAASLDKLQRGRHIPLGIEQWIYRERSESQEVAIASGPELGKGLPRSRRYPKFNIRRHIPPLVIFDDERAEILVQDVFPYLEDSPQPFDLILVDLLDGYDQSAVRLYQNVLPLSQKVLARGGIIAGFGDLAMPRMSIAPLY